MADEPRDLRVNNEVSNSLEPNELAAPAKNLGGNSGRTA